MTKPLRTRLRLIAEAFALMAPGAPFVQFTYAMVPPIPKALAGITARSLRADLAEHAAGARVGLSRSTERVASSDVVAGPVPASRLRMRRRADVHVIGAADGRCPKILVLPGSIRAGSHNVRLAALAAKELTLIDADVTRISLADYPLPIYDGRSRRRSRPAGQRASSSSR